MADAVAVAEGVVAAAGAVVVAAGVVEDGVRVDLEVDAAGTCGEDDPGMLAENPVDSMSWAEQQAGAPLLGRMVAVAPWSGA